MWHLYNFMQSGRHTVYAQFYGSRYETLAKCAMARGIMTTDQYWKKP